MSASFFKNLGLTQSVVSELVKLANASPTFASEVAAFSAQGGVLQLGQAGAGTFFGYGSGTPSPTITIDPNALQSGQQILNPFGSGEVILDQAETALGLIAHEFGHFEDPANPAQEITSIDKSNPANECIFVAEALGSEGKAAWNQYQVQKEIWQNVKSLTLFDVTGDIQSDYKIELDLINKDNTQALGVPYLADQFTGAAASTEGGKTNYLQLYMNSWTSHGGATAAGNTLNCFPSGTDPSDFTWLSDPNGNINGFLDMLPAGTNGIPYTTEDFGSFTPGGTLQRRPARKR